jgi:hypothetical protein
MEHALLQAIAQRVCSLVGLELDELSAIPRLDDQEARLSWLGALASELQTRAARELAFTMAFLVSISDLDLVAAEQSYLEELQRAMGVEDRRATELVIQLTEMISPEQNGSTISA